MSFQILLDEVKTNLTKCLQDLSFPSVLFSVEPAKKEQEEKKSKKGAKVDKFGVKRSGDATVVFIGFCYLK